MGGADQLQVTDFCIYIYKHPKQKISQLNFLRSLKHKHIIFDRKKARLYMQSKFTNYW